ncbi:MAG: type II toxin-antitoxin system VapC family toxin [Solirubrobacterales bacterium]
MSFFVDTNVVIYSAVESAHREPCRQILTAIARGEAEGRTSVAVLEEVWHVELSGKAGDIGGLAAHALELFTPLLGVTDEIFRAALSLDGAPIGANDRIHVATCAENDIATIVTADAGFDSVGALSRVDPLDEPALKDLLAT